MPAPAAIRPSLAVVINNFNHESYVGAAIDSVLALGDAVDEVWVVDDGSTDGSRALIQGYGARVRTLFQANAGQLAACLAALARTRCDYVWFLDADDMAAPQAASAMPPALAGRPAKVQFRLQSVDSSGAPLPSVFPPFPAAYGREAMLRDMARWGFYVTPPTSGNVFRRDVVERAGRETIAYETAIDGLPLYLAPVMGEVVTLEAPLALYRLHGSNLHQQHVLDARRLEKEIARFSARSEHFARLPEGFALGEGAGLAPMMREWRMMADVAQGRRARGADAAHFLRGLWAASFKPKVKLMLTAWTAAVTLLPDWARRTACAWRLSPLNRPRWLNRRLSAG